MLWKLIYRLDPLSLPLYRFRSLLFPIHSLLRTPIIFRLLSISSDDNFCYRTSKISWMKSRMPASSTEAIHQHRRGAVPGEAHNRRPHHRKLPINTSRSSVCKRRAILSTASSRLLTRRLPNGPAWENRYGDEKKSGEDVRKPGDVLIIFFPQRLIFSSAIWRLVRWCYRGQVEARKAEAWPWGQGRGNGNCCWE